MAQSDNHPANKLYNSRLYKALTQAKREKVVELCREAPEGPLRVVSVHDDTVLHLASYSMQVELVDELLKMVTSAIQLEKMSHQNGVGNTILHEAAAFNKLVPAARKMLELQPELLSMHNNFGETALYRAVRYGQEMMFVFLDGEVNKRYQNTEDICKKFYIKEDQSSNILHTAVSAEHFDLALLIARKYEYLVVQRDNKGWTPLQLLARSSFALQRTSRRRRRFYYSVVGAIITPSTEEGWRVPWWEAIKKEKREYESASKLAELLVRRDTSCDCEETNHVQEVERKGINSSTTPKQIYETPLFTATKSGCIDIVDLILKMYPQAVDHVDHNNGHTILHVAIKHRQMEVFNMVEKMEFPMRRLIEKVDKDLNSILHMVGKKEEKYVLYGNSSVLELRKNLFLFERIERISSKHFLSQENSEGLTPEQLCTINNEKLRKDANEWIVRMVESLSIAAVLIVTIAFAAIYTVPGGFNQETGVPILLHQKYFLIFTTADVLSLGCTFMSLLSFLWIFASPFQLEDFKHSLPTLIVLGVGFLITAVIMLVFAFAATIALMIQSNKHWYKTVPFIVAFPLLSLSVFALYYIPMYLSLVRYVVTYPIRKIGAFFPRYVRESGNSHPSNAFKRTYTQSSTSNHPPPDSNHESQKTRILI